jgi:O-antigen ligase
MPLAALAAVFFAPLILTPHLLFYFDITPKVVLLLLAAAVAFAFCSQQLDSFAALWGTRPGRWYCLGAGAAVALAGITTALSSHRALAWGGASWRRLGAVTEFALIFAATAIAAYVLRDRARLIWLLRCVCAAGSITAVYGIVQYFGWDPFLPRAGYEAGEGIFQIVRPPGTLGHSDYFGAFLLWPIFAGIGLLRADSRLGRALGVFACASGAAAIVLSGSRGSILALLAGLCALAALLRPNLRAVAAAGMVAAVALAGFYFSPAGERLRARAHWIGEDRAGGARPLLWRDTLRMAAAKPLTGFGLDTFEAEFPHYQSETLARTYPDFYHESPHNIFLDALTAEGLFGLLALAGIVAAAILGGLRARQKDPLLAVALLPAFAATLVAHQFIVFTAPTAFYFFMGAALLSASGSRVTARGPNTPIAPVHIAPVWRWTALAAGVTIAGLLCMAAYHLAAGDASLATVQRRLDANDPRGAAEAYRMAVARIGPDAPANLYFSRRWAAVASQTQDTISRIYYGQIAAGAASLATKSPEQPQNAWFNLAALGAEARDVRTMETALRSSIAAAPVWYKPHWALARLLAAEGRLREAEPEARRAEYLNAGKDAEVASTLSGIPGSAGSGP